MSLQFNDTVNYKGAVQIYEKECGLKRGAISGDTDKMKEFTADYNLGTDDLFSIGFKYSRTWQLDDTNYDNYSILFFNLTSGQRDYPLDTDEDGNLIVDIYRVLVADASGVFHEVTPVDQQTANNNNSDTLSFVDGRNTTGQPTKYDKTNNAIIFDLVPNYTVANGIQVLVNREASYMNYTDTQKKPGIPGTIQLYPVLKAAMAYTRRNDKDRYDRLAIEVAKYEGERGLIAQAFGLRERDVKRRMVANVESTK